VRAANVISKSFQNGLYTSVAELILLGAVNAAGKPIYGYQIARMMDRDNEAPVIKLGSLYPILRSLESDGLLESQVDPSVTGPPRRYYKITPAGVQALRELTAAWERTQTFVDNMIKGAGK
jgi:PadR family transcriptional regulator, regulatory protein PadR